MQTCINCPTRMASARCKRCGKPLCNDCKMISEVGVVCSQQCLDAIKSFQDRIADDVPHPAKRPLMSRGAVKGLLAAAILFAVAYAILCWHAKRILSPGDILDQLDLWRRFFSTYV